MFFQLNVINYQFQTSIFLHNIIIIRITAVVNPGFYYNYCGLWVCLTYERATYRSFKQLSITKSFATLLNLDLPYFNHIFITTINITIKDFIGVCFVKSKDQGSRSPYVQYDV